MRFKLVALGLIEFLFVACKSSSTYGNGVNRKKTVK